MQSGRMPEAMAAGTQVTVVIPVWDEYTAFVEEAVLSLAGQGPVLIRLVVIDNASTVPIPPLPLHSTIVRTAERLSVGAARNIGLRLAETPFVSFLDADDIVMPGTIPLLVSRLLARPELTAAACAPLAWDPDTGTVWPLTFPSPRTLRVARWPAFYRVYAAAANRIPTTGCVVMRTDLARSAGGFSDANFAEDWPLNVGLAFRGPIELLPVPGRRLRVHPRSLRSRPLSRAEVRRGFDLTYRRLKLDPATPALVRRLLRLLALHHAFQVRRLTPGGVLRPGRALVALSDAPSRRVMRGAQVAVAVAVPCSLASVTASAERPSPILEDVAREAAER
jgi:glycosyl transferase family 2